MSCFQNCPTKMGVFCFAFAAPKRKSNHNIQRSKAHGLTMGLIMCALHFSQGLILSSIERQESVTHWEEHNGDGESNGCEHRHSDAQDEGVVWVDPAVGVQELRLNVPCGNGKRRTQ